MVGEHVLTVTRFSSNTPHHPPQSKSIVSEYLSILQLLYEESFEKVLLSAKEKHKHKQHCEIAPGLGGCQKLVYVTFFGVIPHGGEKHINKIPLKIPQIFCLCVCVCFLRLLFSLPILSGVSGVAKSLQHWPKSMGSIPVIIF